MASADFPQYRYRYYGTSPGKSFFLPPIPAASTYLPRLYSLGFARTWLLTRITMPHIPFLFVSTGFCSPASLLTLVFIFIRVRDCFAIQCILYNKPPCGLLTLSGLTPTYKGLSPSGKTHTCYGLSQKDLYFWTFSTAYNKCALHDAQAGHTHASSRKTKMKAFRSQNKRISFLRLLANRWRLLVEKRNN